MAWVDKYGRATAHGIRRVYSGNKSHDGRPLPFELQVRPQRAEPTIRATGSFRPWAKMFGVTYNLLIHAQPVPHLITPDSVSPYEIHLDRVIVYKVIKEFTVADAHGTCEALCLYYDKDYELWLLQ